MNVVTKILGITLAVLGIIVAAPFIAVAYLAYHITSFWYYGWSKAEEHSRYLVKLIDSD